MSKKHDQKAMVLGWLLSGERLTQQDAFGRGVERLGARIWDLKKLPGLAGLIETETITVTKATTGGQARVACYFIRRENLQRAMAIARGQFRVGGGAITRVGDKQIVAVQSPVQPVNKKDLFGDLYAPLPYGATEGVTS